MRYANPKQRMMMDDAEDFRFNQRELLSGNVSTDTVACVSFFGVQPNLSDWANIVSFQVNKVSGVSSIIVYRGTTNDINSAVVLATYAAAGLQTGNKISFVDRDLNVAGRTLYYWVKVVSNSTEVKPLVIGPVGTEAHQVETIPPVAVSEFHVSKSAASEGTVEVAVAFKNSDDPRFYGVRIYAEGYRGNPDKALIADSTHSPFLFLMDQTGEDVTLYCATVNENGNDGEALSHPLALNASVTAPNKLTDVTITSQLGGVQVDFTGGAESYLTGYEVRRQKMDGSSDTLVESVPVSTGNLRYTVVDRNGYSDKFRYYVIAKSDAGNSIASDFVSIVSLAEIPGTAADIRYNSGKTVEELMPAEAGADVAKPLAQAASEAAEAARLAAETAQTDATTANNAITDMAADNKLTPVEKTDLVPTIKKLVDSKASLDTQADNAGVSRVAYDNAIAGLISYLASLGLSQAVRGNYSQFSSKFDSWYSVNCLPAVAGYTAPDGSSNTCWWISPNSTVGPHYVYLGETNATGAVSTRWCSSVYIKPSSYSWVRMVVNATNMPGPSPDVHFDCINKTAVINNGTNVLAGVQDAGNGWVRLWMSFDVTSSTVFTNVPINIEETDGATYKSTFAGDGIRGVWLWGFQLEPYVSQPTPLIQTTTPAPVTVTDYERNIPAWKATTNSVVGTELRSRFATAYTEEVNLLNAVAAKAKALADAAHSKADTAFANAAVAQSDATSALSKLSDIVSDNVLTPDEKPSVLLDYNTLVNEQAGIDAQASAYAIVAEKTSYDNAITALTTYLATLTTPVLWSNLTDKTTIVGTTFRQKFQDAYLARQVLLNAIYTQAKNYALTSSVDATRVNFKVGGGNLLRQSNFETDSNADGYADGWMLYSGVQAGSAALSLGAFQGTYCQTFKADGAAPSPRVASTNRPYVPAGNKCVVTAWMKATAGAALFLVAKACQTALSGENGTYQTATVVATGAWQRVKIPAFATTTAIGEYLFLGCGLSGTPAAGTQVWIDAVQVEMGDVETSWAPAVQDALDAASLAQTAAATAQQNADSALTQLNNIASDNYLTQDEKPSVILDYNVLTGEQTGIDTQATTYGITTEKIAYDNTVAALTTYLGTLTAPKPWNDLTDKTSIVGSTFRQKFADVYNARQVLLNAIYGKAKALADAAKTTADEAKSAAADAQAKADDAYTKAHDAQIAADNALNQLGEIGNDNMLSTGEKSAVILDWNSIYYERDGILAQANAYGLGSGTEATTYNTSVNTLSSYLSSLTPSWSDTSVSTPINGSTFRANFQDVYTKRQALLNSIYAKAKSLADDAKATADAALPGATLASTYINGDGTYNLIKYHASAAKRLITNNISGGGGGGTWTTVASFTLVLPSGCHGYQGILRGSATTTRVDGCSWNHQTRIKIGSNVSNIVGYGGVWTDEDGDYQTLPTMTGSTSKSGLVQIIAELSGTIVVEIQSQVSYSGSCTFSTSFSQVEYADQDAGNFL